MSMAIGDYIISNHCNLHRIMWMKGNERLHYDMDLNTLLKDHIEGQIYKLANAIHMFDYLDIDSILKDPLCKAIIDYMPNPDLVPGSLSPTEELEFNRCMIVEGYNNAFKTHFTYNQVLLYL